MKSLTSLFVLVLITAVLFGQDMLLKKQTVILENGFEFYVHYKYDAAWKLDSIIYVSELGETSILQLFEDERLVFDDRGSNKYSYTYYEDSVISYSYWNENTHKYYFDENFEVHLQKNYGPTGENYGNITSTWINGNCKKAVYSTGQVETMIYDANYLNPHQNENKFFKHGFSGSKNFMTHGEFISFTNDQMVVSSQNGYPTEVDFSDGNEDRTLLYEYYDFTGVENGIFEDNTQIIDIRYFNLLGQQIEKPAKGFYIEKKLLEKGVISKKYFIP